jgi:large subunit ribosomal protein L35
MPKQKTNKRISKTFWVTGSGKLMRRKTGQDHFNSRESGNTTKMKRRDLVVSSAEHKKLLNAFGK